jgi:hypothetical protein
MAVAVVVEVVVVVGVVVVGSGATATELGDWGFSRHSTSTAQSPPHGDTKEHITTAGERKLRLEKGKRPHSISRVNVNS